MNWLISILFLGHPAFAQSAFPLTVADQIGRAVMTSDFFCAVTDDGLNCFRNGDPMPVPPGLRNARQVASDDSFIYALDDEGIKRWDRGASGWSRMMAYNGARQISVHGSRGCAVLTTQVDCWGMADAPPPKFLSPRLVSVGPTHACALDRDGVKCWGSANFTLTGPQTLGDEVHFADRTPPPIQTPSIANEVRQVLAAKDETCLVFHDGRSFCADNSTNGKPDWKFHEASRYGAKVSVMAPGVCSLVKSNDAYREWTIECYRRHANHNYKIRYIEHVIPRQMRPARVLVSHETYGFCALTDHSIECSPGYPHAPLNPLEYEASTLSRDFACFIARKKVYCAGKDEAGRLPIPPHLVHAEKGLWSSETFVCVEHNKRNHCWGKVPAGLDWESGYDESRDGVDGVIGCRGERCWGTPEFLQAIDKRFPIDKSWYDWPRFHNAYQRAYHHGRLCFYVTRQYSDSTVTCIDDDGFVLEINELPKGFSASPWGRIFLIDRETLCEHSSKVTCFSFKDLAVHTLDIVADRSLRMYGRNYCFTDYERGLQCKGLTGPLLRSILPWRLKQSLSGQLDFSEENIAEAVRIAGEQASSVRREVLRRLAPYADNLQEASSRILLRGLIRSLIRSGTSEAYLKTVIPAYDQAFQPATLPPWDRSEEQLRAGLTALQVMLRTAEKFFPSDIKTEIAEALRRIGRAHASPLNKESLALALEKTKQLDARLQELQKTESTDFLFEAIRETQEWLWQALNSN